MIEENKTIVSHSKESSCVIPAIVLEAFISHNLVSKVLAKANFPAENACEILKGSEDQSPKNFQAQYSGHKILKMLIFFSKSEMLEFHIPVKIHNLMLS